MKNFENAGGIVTVADVVESSMVPDNGSVVVLTSIQAGRENSLVVLPNGG